MKLNPEFFREVSGDVRGLLRELRELIRKQLHRFFTAALQWLAFGLAVAPCAILATYDHPYWALAAGAVGVFTWAIIGAAWHDVMQRGVHPFVKDRT